MAADTDDPLWTVLLAALPIGVVSEERPQPVLETIAREHDVPLVSTDNEGKLFEAIDSCLSGAARPAVLVVEDDERIAALISDSLCYGFETEIRNNGESGLAGWRERHHDLVIWTWCSLVCRGMKS